MSDHLNPLQRSQTMALVRSKNTKPEMIVRRIVYSMGHRYRLHEKRLPGTPDLVFHSARKIIEVRGCFWHYHSCKHGRKLPANNRQYWKEKILRNATRDAENERLLRKDSWHVLLIWECEMKNAKSLRKRLREFLENLSV